MDRFRHNQHYYPYPTLPKWSQDQNYNCPQPYASYGGPVYPPPPPPPGAPAPPPPPQFWPYPTSTNFYPPHQALSPSNTFHYPATNPYPSLAGPSSSTPSSLSGDLSQQRPPAVYSWESLSSSSHFIYPDVARPPLEYPPLSPSNHGAATSLQPSSSQHQSPALSHSYSWSPVSNNGHPSPRPSPSAYSQELTLYSGKSLKYNLLYGTLDITIHSAKNLPNLDMMSETLRQLTLNVGGLAPWKDKITSDPYVIMSLKDARVLRTKVISNNQNPVWEEHFVISVAHKVAEIKFEVKDNDMLGAQYIGEVNIPSDLLLSKQIREEYFVLLDQNKKPCNSGAQIKLSLAYYPLSRNTLGVCAGPPYVGVPNTYFPLHRGGRVTLYQDVHVPVGSLPTINLASGKQFEHRSCWEDICQAIVDARHLVYIAGWSIYTKIKLVREPDKQRPEAAYKELGELLKWKAGAGGVNVLLLAWDDKTSHALINNDGVMGTHDEETRKYFKHSNVVCMLAPRYADSKLSIVKQQVVGTIYTHHQKLVIVDSNGPPDKRHLTAFIGGLDLCDGRYDTPQHTLFQNFNTVFKDDYHNPTFTTKIESGGPREPWHDLHCKIEGPAAYDVLTNFEQRWRKVTKYAIKTKLMWGFQKDSKWKYHLIDLKQVPWSVKYDGREGMSNVTSVDDPETWNVQLFRSIDSGSVKGFPKDPREAEKQNLIGRKNIAVDDSIHKAYVKAIRSAQHFIYIENQYFLGSAFAWPNYKNAANHLVPIEIALKIVQKIKDGEPFAVYIVVPMWPEGDPKTQAVQEILFFQSQTMEMMYTLIAEALKEKQLDHIYHPTDFLNFFCLANRETKSASEKPPSVQPVENSPQAKAFKNRRFMIYVHSKGMVVDDEYVIIGSANINQRSMDGSRDTEIAMGGYQPYHTWHYRRSAPKGQIYGYRMSLWAEHLKTIEHTFNEPWSQECVKRVKSLAQENWNQFIAEEVTNMRGHLVPYPIKVERSGKVVNLPNFECFPDVGGKILGESTNLPDNLTE